MFAGPRPLVVCGFVRSGTQMCATFLSNSKKVELQGEIREPLAESTLRWMAAVKREQREVPPERFYGLARAVFRDVTAPARGIYRRRVAWFGHKTPGHEHRFSEYERLFDHPQRLACYIYCLRDPFKVWSSYRIMPWNARPSVRRFLRGWVASVRAFEAMKAAAPDRVLLFNLNEMLAAPDRLEWLQTSLFDGLEISSETFRRPVESLENSNSSEAKFGFRPPDLPRTEAVRIASDGAVRGIVARYLPELEPEMEALAGGVKRDSDR